MCGVLDQTAQSSLDSRTGRGGVRPQSAAPGSSRRFHGAPTFGVARCFFCIEKDLTVVSLWRKTSAAAARKRPGQLVAAFYPELRRIAARQIRKRADAAHVATHRCAE